MEYKYSQIFKWKSGKPVKTCDGVIPVYGSNGVIGFCNNAKYKNRIIIGRVGAYCGSVTYCSGEFNATDNTLITECDESKIIYKYAYHVLKLAKLNDYAGGSAQPLITQSILSHLKCNIPTIEIQEKVADILSTYDELIQNNNKRIKILEQMTENLYKEWFVRFRFPDYQNTEFENGIPDGWRTVTLDSILSKIATGLNPRKNFVLGNGDNYYVTIKNMGDNTIYLDDRCDKVDDEAIIKINKRSDLRQGDLLFSGIGTIGRTYLINIPTNNWNISESVFTMRPKKIVSSEYLYMLLLSDDLQNYCQAKANGSAQKGIRMAVLRKYTFLLAPIAIIENFTKKARRILNLISLIREKNQNLAKQRNMLLPRLMSGKLEVK